jgi:2-polyprenyl-6-hydroxyphenyl methylase/3-demethylubiquinone-9 3-methyltransferase
MRQVECKICGGSSAHFTSVDFSKHCNKQLDLATRLSGIAVDYYQCSECDFIFTCLIDDYTKADLLRNIYNEDYIRFDPLYPRIRPEANARFLASVVRDAFRADRRPRVLDYGAGSGMLSRILQDRIFVENYDSLNPEFDRLPIDRRFDLIFCAEVVEHMPFPHIFIRDWQRLLSGRGCVLFSTETQPADIKTLRADWWYLGPRNGHVSIFSRKGLETLCARHGMLYANLSTAWHVAFRQADQDFDLETLRCAVATLPTGFIWL